MTDNAKRIAPAKALLASDVLAQMLAIQGELPAEAWWRALGEWLRSAALLRPCGLCGRPAAWMWDKRHVCCPDPTLQCPHSDGTLTPGKWNAAWNAKCARER